MKLIQKDNDTVYDFLRDIDNIPNGWNQVATGDTNDLSTFPSSIEEWNKYGYKAKMNYKQVREMLKILIPFKATTNNPFDNWNNLSEEEKRIGIEWVVVPYSLRLENVTPEEDKINFENLVEETEECRKNLISALKDVANDYFRQELLSKDKGDYFFEDVSPLVDAYIRTNNPKLKQFIFDEGIYTSSGLGSKSYNISEMQDELKIIIGEYYHKSL